MMCRYAAMLILGALVGPASGFLWMIPNGLMGGALGMSLAAGSIWLGRREPKRNSDLARRDALLAGLVSGLIAGVLMAVISHTLGDKRALEFGPPVLPWWAPLIMGILYGLVVHWGYDTRRYSAYPGWKALFCTCLGCFLLKAVAAAIYIGLFEKERDVGAIFNASAMLSLMGAVPFAFLWILVMRWADPAWAAHVREAESLPPAAVPAAGANAERLA